MIRTQIGIGMCPTVPQHPLTSAHRMATLTQVGVLTLFHSSTDKAASRSPCRRILFICLVSVSVGRWRFPQNVRYWPLSLADRLISLLLKSGMCHF